MNLKETNRDSGYWVHLAEDMDQRRASVNNVMNLQIP
jgi:hypothetical protein